MIREVAAELERGVLLFSGGKDSAVLLHLARKAFYPAALPFPVMHVDTGHNFPEVIEYRDRMVAELGAELIVASRPGLDRQRPRGRGDRPARVAQPAPVRDPARRDRGARLQGRLRRRPPRRGARPRQGAHPLLPRRLRPVGPQGPAARALEPLQRLRQAGRARARVPALELDRARRVAVHRARRGSSSRRSTSPTSARSSSATGCSTRCREFVELLPDEEPFEESVRFRTVGDMSCTGAVRSEAATLEDGRGRDRRHADHRARRDARRRPRLGGGDGGPQEGGVLLSAARPPTATRRRAATSELVRFATAGSVDDGKSTLIGRLLFDTKSIFEDQLEHVERTSSGAATATRTSRCSPTGCAPSASRASRSTSPTATSTRRGASSSSPTPRATSSTRATWSPGASTADLALDARGRAQGRARAVAPARVHRLAAAHPAPRRVRQQDGSRRLRPGGLRPHHATSSRAGRRSSTSTTSPSSRSRRCTATTWSSARSTCPGTRAPRCSTTSSTCTWPPTATCATPRFPVQWVVRPMTDEHHDYRGYAGEVASGVLRAGDEVVVLPSGRTSRIAAHRHLRGRARGGLPAAVGDDAPGGRHRRLARRHDLPARQPARRGPRDRRDGVLDVRAPAVRRRRATGSSTRRARRSPRWTRCATAST